MLEVMARRLERTPIMRVDLLTREYPPFVYGGAGVHVLELAKVLRPRIEDLRVQAFDGPREPGTEGADPGVTGHSPLAQLEGANAALKTLGVLAMLRCGAWPKSYSARRRLAIYAR